MKTGAVEMARRQAVAWEVRLRDEEGDGGQWRAFEHWRAASEINARAWDALQHRLAHMGGRARRSDCCASFGGTGSGSTGSEITGSGSAGVASAQGAAMAGALRAPSDERRRALSDERRHALRAAFGLLVLGVGAWGARTGYHQLGYDANWNSAVGERGNTRLADGTAMAYDADSRIYLAGSTAAPVLRLQQGQLLLAADAASARAITVVTDHGAVQAGGAAFNVGRLRDRSVVSVRSGTVIVRPAGQSRLVLDAGQTCYFNRDGARASELSFAAVSGWTRGVHVADRVPLAELLEVFGRYRAGILRATGPAATRLVSGVFRLHDIDQALLQLADAFPVTISRYGKYVTVLR